MNLLHEMYTVQLGKKQREVKYYTQPDAGFIQNRIYYLKYRSIYYLLYQSMMLGHAPYIQHSCINIICSLISLAAHSVFAFKAANVVKDICVIIYSLLSSHFHTYIYVSVSRACF